MEALCPFCQMCEQRIVMKNDSAYAVAGIAPASPSNTAKSPIFPLFCHIRTTMCYNLRMLMYISNEQKQGFDSKWQSFRARCDRKLELTSITKEITSTETMKVLNV